MVGGRVSPVAAFVPGLNLKKLHRSGSRGQKQPAEGKLGVDEQLDAEEWHITSSIPNSEERGK